MIFSDPASPAEADFAKGGGPIVSRIKLEQGFFGKQIRFTEELRCFLAAGIAGCDRAAGHGKLRSWQAPVHGKL
ncbi:MAG TPA: hypothetical protein VGL71_14785, partial [Urbifossiella sp.]